MGIERIQPASPKIPELVMQELISAIEQGKIQVGEELPLEQDLAKMMGISRTSLRECLVILEFLGAINRPGYRKVVIQGADYIRGICSVSHTFERASSQGHAVMAAH